MFKIFFILNKINEFFKNLHLNRTDEVKLIHIFNGNLEVCKMSLKPRAVLLDLGKIVFIYK
jgi:hypothetical protein